MMRFLFLDWNSFCNQDFIYALKSAGHQAVIFPFPSSGDMRYNPSLEKKLQNILADRLFDAVFSFNYFPFVSDVALSNKIPYIAWVYDSPYVLLLSKNLSNPNNFIFLFDQTLSCKLRSLGYSTVSYLPLAANPDRLQKRIELPERVVQYSADLSFVGSLYNEPASDLYHTLTEKLSPYTLGYLEGLISSQKKIYGAFFLEELLTGTVLEELNLLCPALTDERGFETLPWLIANYYLAREITSRERKELLTALSSRYKLSLYTNGDASILPGAIQKGKADYYLELPYIFRYSKINLNISLRSIQSGIPLRAMDIMGSGGFLLSNFQSDFLEHFVPGKDFVYYEDEADLMNKVEYYLTHEKERLEIAENGLYTVKTSHTFDHRINSIIEVLRSGSFQASSD